MYEDSLIRAPEKANSLLDVKTPKLGYVRETVPTPTFPEAL